MKGRRTFGRRTGGPATRLGWALLLAAALGLLSPAESPAAPRRLIKFATLAPDGSTWMKVMRQFARAVKEKTGGQVRFRIYPGGVQGDEKNVVQKIRIGQLHSAGFTGVGLGEILPEVRVLELPFLFFREEEVDFVHERIDPRLSRAFERKGFVLLGWAEVGLVHLFSKNAIRSRADLERSKLWAWEGDPLAKAYFKALGLAPISLSVTDVLTSLQTGLIDTVYASPLAAIALQWFTRVKYMTRLPVSNATGAVLVSKRVFDRLSPEQRAVLKAEGRRQFNRLIRLSREENRKAIVEIQKEGVELLPMPSPKDLRDFLDVGRSTWKRLSGKLFPPDLLAEVLSALADYRKAHPLPVQGKN
ncbi:MAG: TRAP transporter substrate-binding protein DctP [Nitrospinota bacterium]